MLAKGLETSPRTKRKRAPINWLVRREVRRWLPLWVPASPIRQLVTPFLSWFYRWLVNTSHADGASWSWQKGRQQKKIRDTQNRKLRLLRRCAVRKCADCWASDEMHMVQTIDFSVQCITCVCLTCQTPLSGPENLVMSWVSHFQDIMSLFLFFMSSNVLTSRSNAAQKDQRIVSGSGDAP